MSSPKQISIAIIGGGPGGLGTAIALSELPYVSVKLYEQAPEPREVGAGITISRNGWNVLRLLGAADGVKGAKQGHSWQRCVRFTRKTRTGTDFQSPDGSGMEEQENL